MEEGPWFFRGCALMLEEFDGATNVPTIIPHKVPAWVQIHRMPHLYRAKAILEQMVEPIGDKVQVEMRAYATHEGDFFRARVMLEATKHLVCCVTLMLEGRDAVVLLIKYEKLPRFCSHCGLMGHVHLECGTREFSEEDLQFGEWMIAGEETWRLGTPRVRSNQAPEVKWRRGEASDRGGWTAGRSAGRGRGGRHGPVWREKETGQIAVAPGSVHH